MWNALNALSIGNLNVACEGGWGINTYYALNPTAYVAGYGFYSNVVADFTREDVIVHPLFTPFRSEADSMHSTNLFTISDETYRKNLRAKFLGDAIPATSFAAGRNAITTFGNDGNMNFAGCKRSDAWPRNGGEWRHSDIKDVAYFYMTELYRRIVNGGGNEGTNE